MRRPFAIGLIAAMLALAGIALHYRGAASEAETRALSLGRELAEARFETEQYRARAASVEARAAELDSQLGSAKVRTTATETKSHELTRELTAVRSTLTERQQREVALMAEIESLRQQAARTAPFASAPSPSPSSPASTESSDASAGERQAYARRLAALESQLTELLARALESPAPGLDSVATSPTAAEAVAVSPAHQVVRVGAKDAFVVIDFGAEHGARVGQQLTLARGTSPVARVQISDVRPKFSIAQVLPDASKRQLQAGDIILLAQ